MTSPDAPDRELVAAFLGRRDEAAFRALYRRHAPAVYGILRRLAGPRVEDADDVLQEAWLRAAARLEAFRWESALRTWLIGIAVRCWWERARSARRRGEVVELDPARAAATDDPAPRVDLARAVAALPPGAREVLVLHDVEGYTHREIGELLGIDEGTSKSQLSRARARLRAALAPAREANGGRG